MSTLKYTQHIQKVSKKGTKEERKPIIWILIIFYLHSNSFQKITHKIQFYCLIHSFNIFK